MAVSTAVNLKGADLLDVGLLTKEQFVAPPRSRRRAQGREAQRDRANSG